MPRVMDPSTKGGKKAKTSTTLQPRSAKLIPPMDQDPTAKPTSLYLMLLKDNLIGLYITDICAMLLVTLVEFENQIYILKFAL